MKSVFEKYLSITPKYCYCMVHNENESVSTLHRCIQDVNIVGKNARTCKDINKPYKISGIIT